MWVMGAHGCAVWVSMCPSICPCCVSCSPTVVAGTTQTHTPGSSAPGSPSASDLVGASAGSSATPVPDPRSPALPQGTPCTDTGSAGGSPLARAGAWGSPPSLPVPPSCPPVLGPALFPVLTVSPVTPCTAPLLPVPAPRSGATSSAASVLVLPRRGLCGCPPAADTPGASASPTPVQHPLPVPVSPGASKSQVSALCAGKSRWPGSRFREIPVPVSTVGCSRCQQALVWVNPSASLLAPTSPVAAGDCVLWFCQCCLVEETDPTCVQLPFRKEWRAISSPLSVLFSRLNTPSSVSRSSQGLRSQPLSSLAGSSGRAQASQDPSQTEAQKPDPVRGLDAQFTRNQPLWSREQSRAAHGSRAVPSRAVPCQLSSASGRSRGGIVRDGRGRTCGV
ncbi:uncharacterized protein LOC108962108 [Serinus canaria]|uniref:uncharacterized protein LOC108962108 n=1 Tax=Serinus canaria TaxID=9135 RepID=UPI0021CCBF62|nr:uncharacterized protein LOC108962108 [Serinus canaria]